MDFPCGIEERRDRVKAGKGLQVSLAAEVARTYVELRTYQERRALVEANIRIQEATYQLYLSRYQAGLSDEVENALTAFGKEQQRLDPLERAVAAAEKAEVTALDRYQAGLVDFTDVLDAQRTLQAFQNELAQSCGAVTADLIRLYKALGGGWIPETAR